MHRQLLKLALVVAALAVIAVPAIGAGAAQKMLHPSRAPIDREPAAYLPFEDVRFAAEPGILLDGWWIPADADRGTVLLLHGFGKSRLEVLPHASYLHEAGYNVLLFDWRAHGRSGGSFTSLGYHEQSDLRAAVDEALRHSNAPVVAMGYSMGAAIAILEGADDTRIRALVSDSSFATIEGSLNTAFPILANLPSFPFAPIALRIAELQTGLQADDVRPVDAIGRWSPRPVLMIIGSKDELVRRAEANDLANAAGETARLLVFDGAGHPSSECGDSWHRDPDRYRHEVLAFLEQSR